MNKPNAASPELASVEGYRERYADDPLKYRVMMRLYGARANPDLQELAESLRAHPADVRKSVRMLTEDGLVAEHKDQGRATYSLATRSSARWLVTELLRRAIDRGGKS